MRTALWIVLALNVAGSLSAEEDWRQFRGPTGEGHSGANRLPLNWDENHKVVGKTAIHDHEWSSPVTCGKQIWMTAAAVCIDALFTDVPFEDRPAKVKAAGVDALEF